MFEIYFKFIFFVSSNFAVIPDGSSLSTSFLTSITGSGVEAERGEDEI